MPLARSLDGEKGHVGAWERALLPIWSPAGIRTSPEAGRRVWRDAGLLAASPLHSWYCLEQETMFRLVEQPKHARYCWALDGHTVSSRAFQRWMEAETRNGKASCPSHAVSTGRAGSAGREDSSTGAVSLKDFSMGHY